MNRDVKNAISMAHDTSLVLNLMAQKIQSGDEITEDDLSAVPTIAAYSSQVMKSLLSAYEDQGDKGRVTEDDIA